MKKWYQSSTIWINLAGVALIALDVVLQGSMIPDPDVTAILLALANILRRFTAPKKIEVIEKAVI